MLVTYKERFSICNVWLRPIW